MSKHWFFRPFAACPAAAHDSRPRAQSRLRLSPSEIRIALLGGIAFAFAFVGLPSAEPAWAGGSTRVQDPWTVSITDGDTFRYRGNKIRIADIDTPEVRGRCEHERKLAARATDRMEALLHKAPFEMRPIPGRDEDRYGRKLRVIVRNGRSLGDQLVAEGLARTWEGRRRPWCS